MTITIHPIDASGGLPAYTAQQTRQGWAALLGGGSGRQLGARSGFRVGTPSNVATVTSTTWTLGPCAAIIDPGASTHQGPYQWASDANITGSVTAADATNPRKDILYIRVNDASAGDGSGARDANVYYLAGTPAPSPSAPALPSRSFLVATIDVPASGGGSPTATLNPVRVVAAGGILPVADAAERNALTNSAGLSVSRGDVPGKPVEIGDGAAWHRQISPIIQANTQHAGSGMALNAFTTGLLQPIIQAGSTVIPQEANGYGTITFPQAFPNGVIAAYAVNGDNAATGRGWSVSLGSGVLNTTSLFVNLSNGSGVGYSTGVWRCDWFAIGW